MTALPLRYFGIGVEHDRVDPQTRRREQVEPYAVLRVSNGKTVRDVPLTEAKLISLIAEAATALEDIRKIHARRAAEARCWKCGTHLTDRNEARPGGCESCV